MISVCWGLCGVLFWGTCITGEICGEISMSEWIAKRVKSCHHMSPTAAGIHAFKQSTSRIVPLLVREFRGTPSHCWDIYIYKPSGAR